MTLSEEKKTAIEYNLTKDDLMIFLTEWELDFLHAIKYQRALGKRVSKKQLDKEHEIEAKLQEIEDEIKNKIKNRGASHIVVDSALKTRSINLSYFIGLKYNDLRFTILTDAQKKAIKKIKDYWSERTRNYKNWKRQKHWNYTKENISSRIDESLYNKLKEFKKGYINKKVKNFVRTFLRSYEFRELFHRVLDAQYQKDISIPILDGPDPTTIFTNLINIFPRVVSGKVYTLEKELFTFYFTFLDNKSISYALRVALIHFRYLNPEPPIEREEVIPILLDLIDTSEEMEEI